MEQKNKKAVVIVAAIMAVVGLLITAWVANSDQRGDENNDIVVLYCNQSIAEIAKTDSAYTKAMAAARSFTFEKNGVKSSINTTTFVNNGMNSIFALSSGEVVEVTVSNDIINVVVNGNEASYATGCPLSLKGRSTGDSGQPKMATGTKAGKKAAKPEQKVEVMDDKGEVEGTIEQDDIFEPEEEDINIEDRVINDKPLPSQEPVEDTTEEDEIWDEPVQSETVVSEEAQEVVEETTVKPETFKEEVVKEQPITEETIEEPVEEKVEEVEETKTTPVVEVENPTNQQIFDGEDEIW